MVWAKFSDDWSDQPAIVRLSNVGFRAYVDSILYVSRYTTDGHIPAETLRVRDRKRATTELVDAGLWEPAEGGFYAPLWHEHTPPRAELHRIRLEAADRARRRRKEEQRDQ